MQGGSAFEEKCWNHGKEHADDSHPDGKDTGGKICRWEPALIIHNNPAFKDQDVSAPAISKIINSIVKDVHLRSFLGRYFRYELIKKQKLNI